VVFLPAANERVGDPVRTARRNSNDRNSNLNPVGVYHWPHEYSPLMIMDTDFAVPWALCGARPSCQSGVREHTAQPTKWCTCPIERRDRCLYAPSFVPPGQNFDTCGNCEMPRMAAFCHQISDLDPCSSAVEPPRPQRSWPKSTMHRETAPTGEPRAIRATPRVPSQSL
jgi:hypothetical protein